MFNFKKSKILISVVLILVAVEAVSNLKAYATEPSGIITPTNATTTDGEVGATNTGNTENKAGNNSSLISPTVGAANNTANRANLTNTNVSNAANNVANSSNYTNTGRLPYAGTNSSMVFVVIALAASAAYAFKKVSDYNL